MEEDGVEPPESEDTRFTVWPATTYGILFLILALTLMLDPRNPRGSDHNGR